MATDLSDLAADSIWPTSQVSGGRPADASRALTAPGTASLGSDQADTDVQPFGRPIADDGLLDEGDVYPASGYPASGPIQWKRPGE
jgi:hypothetical protein